MNHTVLLIVALLISTVACASTSMNPLQKHQWEHRLIVFTLNQENRKEFEQALKKHQSDLEERDMILVPLGVSLEHDLTVSLPPEDQRIILERFDLTVGKTELVLIGKDGGAKEKIDHIDIPYFLRAVDQMPMRQMEMRKRNADTPHA